MKDRKKDFLTGQTSVRNRFKVFRQIIYCILFLLAVIFMVMCLGSMEDVVEGSGTVVGIRDYDLKTLVSAKVSKVYRHSGEEVAAGELLLEFDAQEQKDKIALLEHELQELLQELSVKEQDLVILRKDPLPEHFRHTRLHLDEAKAREERHRQLLDIYTRLFKSKTITLHTYLDAELAHLNSVMTLRRYEDDWAKVQSGMAQDILAKAEKEYELLKKRIASKRKEIEVAVGQLENYKLYAPDAGVVTDIPPRAGGYYSRGEVVVKFSANQNKKVIALVDEKLIFKVKPDQQVRIYCQQYNYLDYGYFSGKVTDIYQLPVEKDGINYYPVRIVLDTEEYPLRFGSGCEVKIVTGHDKILWVMLGLRGERFRDTE